MVKSALRALPPCIAASTAHVTHDDSRLALIMLQENQPQTRQISDKASTQPDMPAWAGTLHHTSTGPGRQGSGIATCNVCSTNEMQIQEALTSSGSLPAHIL
jgi:hypothetical protein